MHHSSSVGPISEEHCPSLTSRSGGRPLTWRHEWTNVVAGEEPGRAVQFAAPPLGLVSSQHANDVVLLERQLIVVQRFVRVQGYYFIWMGRQRVKEIIWDDNNGWIWVALLCMTITENRFRKFHFAGRHRCVAAAVSSTL